MLAKNSKFRRLHRMKNQPYTPPECHQWASNSNTSKVFTNGELLYVSCRIEGTLDSGCLPANILDFGAHDNLIHEL